MTDFEQIYKDYFRDVFLYVRRLSGGDERLAEDITSEAFFRALRRIDSFRGNCDIRVWLCQIAKNCYYILLGTLLAELLITLLACGSIARKNLYQIVKGAEA